MFIFHLILIHLGKWNNVTSITITCKKPKIYKLFINNEWHQCTYWRHTKLWQIVYTEHEQGLKDPVITLNSVFLLHFSLIIIILTVNSLSLDIIFLVRFSINHGPRLLHLLLRYLCYNHQTRDIRTLGRTWESHRLNFRNTPLCIPRCGWSVRCR